MSDAPNRSEASAASPALTRQQLLLAGAGGAALLGAGGLLGDLHAGSSSRPHGTRLGRNYTPLGFICHIR